LVITTNFNAHSTQYALEWASLFMIQRQRTKVLKNDFLVGKNVTNFVEKRAIFDDCFLHV
jgi:hypothetical protein